MTRTGQLLTIKPNPIRQMVGPIQPVGQSTIRQSLEKTAANADPVTGFFTVEFLVLASAVIA